MRQPRAAHHFVARADLVPDLHSNDRCLGLFHDQRLHAVGQGIFLHSWSGGPGERAHDKADRGRESKAASHSRKSDGGHQLGADARAGAGAPRLGCLRNGRTSGGEREPSWPQAPSTSRPLLLRMKTSRPRLVTMLWNRRMASSEGRWKELPGNSLNGIKLILQRIFRTRCARRRASSSLSFSFFSSTYSKVRRWRGLRGYFLQASRRAFREYARLAAGMSRLRCASVVAFNDTARLIPRSATRLSRGASPAVERVI